MKSASVAITNIFTRPTANSAAKTYTQSVIKPSGTANPTTENIRYFETKSGGHLTVSNTPKCIQKLGKVIRLATDNPAIKWRTDPSEAGIPIKAGWDAIGGKTPPRLWLQCDTSMSGHPTVQRPATHFSSLYQTLESHLAQGETHLPLFSAWGNSDYMAGLNTEFALVHPQNQPIFLAALKTASPAVHQAFVEWLVINAGSPTHNGLSRDMAQTIRETQSQMATASSAEKIALTKTLLSTLKATHPRQYAFLQFIALTARNQLDKDKSDDRLKSLSKSLEKWGGPDMAKVLIKSYYEVFPDVLKIDPEDDRPILPPP